MITQNELINDLNYDKDTGLFTWKHRSQDRFKSYASFMRWNGQYAGKTAGTDNNGYIKININRQQYLAHRLAWLYVYGVFPDECVDHINGIGADNRLVNLRVGTQAQNKQNLRSAKVNNSIGYLGVAKTDYGKFKASIDHIHLGVFDTAEQAHECYLKFKREFHEFNTI